MNSFSKTVDRMLRGPSASRMLVRLGIDPVRFWLLMDLFGTLSERRELMSQLGKDAVTLRSASWAYYILSAFMALMFLFAGIAPGAYYTIFLAMTTFLLCAMLVSETSSSLVNPVEALVLAHHPINGATFTAAKLTHLLRIIFYLVPGIALIPAFAGLLLKQCVWYYPIAFLAGAYGLALVVALACCAIFGWLIRLLPPARLRAAGMTAEMLPWLIFLGLQGVQTLHLKIRLPRVLAVAPEVRIWLGVALALAAIVAGVFGIRALSVDYLVRVAAMVQSGSSQKFVARRSRIADLVARLAGGPPARAGFEFLSRMMLRDWFFRRSLLGLIPLLFMTAGAAFEGARISPFSGRFSMMHVLPHAYGVFFYAISGIIIFGNDHRGAWIFLLAPARAYGGLARGMFARLLLFILVPQILLAPVLAWFWGVQDAALFSLFAAAIASVYLSLEIRLIEGMPFCRHPESNQNFFTLPVMIIGGLIMGIAVGVQHFLLFRSAIAVAAVTLLAAAAAWFITPVSLETFETNIRYHLGILSTESKGIYTEVEM